MDDEHDGRQEGWETERDDSERLRGSDDRQMDRQTDICNSSFAFATENTQKYREGGRGQKGKI